MDHVGGTARKGAKKAKKACCGCFDDVKKFLSKGNVVDMAVGIVLGSAFMALITSVVKDVFTPILALMGGGGNLEEKFWILRHGNDADSLAERKYATIEKAAEAEAVTLNYGRFLLALINFLIIGLVIFIIIKLVLVCMRRRKEPEPPNTDWPCPMCCEPVKEAARRCPHCTAENIANNKKSR